jgi:hypothetical protein
VNGLTDVGVVGAGALLVSKSYTGNANDFKWQNPVSYSTTKSFHTTDLKLIADDGFFLIDFAHLSSEQKQQVKQPIIDYLTKLYFDNKKKFAKNIKKDLKSY